MGKLILKPNPTFTKDVSIHVPGGEPMVINIEYKHKKRKELQDFLYGDEAKDRSDIDALMEIMKDWPGQDVPFSREALVELTQSYHGASTALMLDYVEEIQKVRRGN